MKTFKLTGFDKNINPIVEKTLSWIKFPYLSELSETKEAKKETEKGNTQVRIEHVTVALSHFVYE